MDDRAVVRYFVSGGPPANDVFVRVDPFVELVNVHGVVEFSLDLIIVFFVWDTEAVGDFYDTFVGRS